MLISNVQLILSHSFVEITAIMDFFQLLCSYYHLPMEYILVSSHLTRKSILAESILENGPSNGFSLDL